VLVHVDLGVGRRRLGGSALAQAYNQLGNDCPDVTSAALKGMWVATQELIAAGHVCAGHDISDGGIATTLLEMACELRAGLDVHSYLILRLTRKAVHAACEPRAGLGAREALPCSPARPAWP
jgi:phosphoribosylformylglycinamidine (FGAM) synthase-like enzyme